MCCDDQIYLCRTCSQVEVSDQNDSCSECKAEILETEHDRMREMKAGRILGSTPQQEM